MHRTLLTAFVCLFLGATSLETFAARAKPLLPFVPAEFSGEWNALSCADGFPWSWGHYVISIDSHRRVVGAFYEPEGTAVMTIKGVVSRGGVVRARIVRRGTLRGVVNVTSTLTLSGFFSGKCAGVFAPVAEQPPVVVTNIYVTNIIYVTNSTSLFPDPNLLVAMGSAVGKPGELVNTMDLQTLWDISLRNRWVRDLSGLEYAQGLWRIDLSGNPITNYAPIFNLPRLHDLSLGTGVRDVSFMTNFPLVWNLTATDGLFTDVSPLARMTNLATLDLSRTPVTNLGALGTAPLLSRLTIASSTFEDLSALSGLTRLTSLYLDGNRIKDVRPLAALTNLTDLSLWNNRLTNVAELGSLRALRILGIGNCGVGEVSWISGLTNVETLYAGYNPLTNVAGLAALKKLRHLDLYYSAVTDLTPLSGLPELREVFASYMGCSNLAFAATLPKLSYLAMVSNNISDITALSSCTNLSSLGLSINHVTDLTPLSSHWKLYSLSVSQNGLTNLSGIENLRQMTYFEATENHISDLSALSNLQALEYVNLRNNDITDISALLTLPKLRYVELSGNRLDLTEGAPAAEVVAQLQARNVDVSTYDQRP